MRGSSQGRPRDPQTDEAILEAALRVIASGGYARMTMDAVAAKAEVSKPTIYLRYGSKEDLATAAVAYLRVEHAPQYDRDLRGNLTAQLRHFRSTFERMSGMSVLGTALVEERQTPEFMQLWRERTAVPYHRLLKEILEHARKEREIDADADLDMAVDMMLGAYYSRYLSGGSFPDDWPQLVVTAVLKSLDASE